MILNLKVDYDKKNDKFILTLGDVITDFTTEEYYKLLRHCETQIADPYPFPTDYYLGTETNTLMRFKDCKPEYFTTIVSHLRKIYTDYLFDTEVFKE